MDPETTLGGSRPPVTLLASADTDTYMALINTCGHIKIQQTGWQIISYKLKTAHAFTVCHLVMAQIGSVSYRPGLQTVKPPSLGADWTTGDLPSAR